MDKEIYEIISSVVYTNYEISSMLKILEDYCCDNSVNSETIANIYNMTAVINEKHNKSLNDLGSLL